MSSAQELIIPLSKIRKDDTSLVGGKGANLGEMIAAGFPVPNGFALTIYAYDLFLEENGIYSKIFALLKDLDVSNTDRLTEVAKKIQAIIKNSKVPQELIKEVISFYKKLSGFMNYALVAVRTSATAEDMPKTSFAGMGETILNVKGEANLLEAVKRCWASLFTARSIFYRVENKIPHEKVKISVIVQKMIQSSVSGVIFSIDPVTNEKDKIVIESVWGLGEMIVQGSVTPDRYVVQKETFKILSKEISEQEVQLIKIGTETKEVKVLKHVQDRQKITDEEIIKLAKYADRLQKHYYFPQDIEWAKEKNKLYIVQTRPVTTLGTVKKETKDNRMPGLTPVLTGAPASPGIGSGEVKIVRKNKEISKIKDGDVLVAKMTSPDYVPAMKKASAIITDEGGLTSHAAIVSRELGIPCVVGTKDATTKLKEGVIVTVDGEIGEVYFGSIKKVSKKPEIPESISLLKIKTATKLYVNLAEPENAEKVAKLPVDGVGLLRAEFMISGIGIHPKEAIKLKKQDDFVEKLAKQIETFAKAFYPRPVIYRTTDFKTNEYRSLKGGKYWEPKEPNPLMGFRGAFRYVANPDVFNLELEAIKKVREKYENLHIMIPYVRSPNELKKVRNLVASSGLFAKSSFKFWMMVELPVNVILLEDFIKVGLDGVSIGSNDLTMLFEGTDRDNSEVSSAFDERSPAIAWAIKRIIKICGKYHISVSICGQAPSEYEDFAENLVKMGITSISVNPDAIYRIKNVIVNTE
ncbi:phosphoenolpyruvate synthase [Candidatus Woesebacteria bacterium CG_4_9_14_3_um_filter_39_10]|uniref:Phosphoenolpyruvate synthase n=1 Tax=Candidatus Woesebacteria bacterium CG_4_9_14_3_um_filter_39_10 TaxID=1975056 RepID=A0A2M7X9J4_9BACT|nr:MAG: phosphoenolpyruvate synthase [Candidatus Woesebacteria bacterium CG_4_9_14_3_um_filter_39_10]